MRFPECKRCFHIIGEHLLCREHGGESGWSQMAYLHRPKPIDLCPPEEMNDYKHPWWDFLDDAAPQLRTKKKSQQAFLEEAIP